MRRKGRRCLQGAGGEEGAAEEQKKGQPRGECLQTAPSLGFFEKRDAGQNKTKMKTRSSLARLPVCRGRWRRGSYPVIVSRALPTPGSEQILYRQTLII